MRKLLLGLVLALSLAVGVKGQTTSIGVGVNPGDPSWVTFTMPGDTEIVIQCFLGRGFYITNVGVYGKQQSTEFQIQGCTGSSVWNGHNYIASYLLIGTASVEVDGAIITIENASWSGIKRARTWYGNGGGLTEE